MTLLFDGHCNVCNFAVSFVLARDHRHQIRFAPLQSETARTVLAGCCQLKEWPDSVVLIEGDKVFVKSRACFRILSVLGWPWKALAVFRILPVSVNDFFYDLFARYRYRIFGRREQCRLLSPAEKALFLDRTDDSPDDSPLIF